MLLAKKFDLDRDGRLNTNERRNLDKAIKNGFIDNFSFGHDQAGHMRPANVVQKKNIQDIKEELKCWGHTGGSTGHIIMKSDSE